MNRTHAHRAAATALLLTLALSGCNLALNRESECREQGGEVFLDDTKVATKNGRRIVEREYECRNDKGEELFEWKVRSGA